MIDDREWRQLGREKARAFAAETKRGMAAGEPAEIWARKLAEATAKLAGEYVLAGASQDELRAFVDELLADFEETIRDGRAG